jgi:peptidoglycan hydrolase-like protein with peptidoglycan-binding domain
LVLSGLANETKISNVRQYGYRTKNHSSLAMKTLFLIFAVALFSASAWGDELTKSVQQKLKDQGFFYGEATGQPGSETDAAVRRYQIRYGLKVTGGLNEETMHSLGLKPNDFPPPQNAARHGNENTPVTPNSTPKPQVSAPQALPPRTISSPTPRPRLATPHPSPSQAARPKAQPETPPMYRSPDEQQGPDEEMSPNESPRQNYGGRPPQNNNGEGPPQNYAERRQNGAHNGSIFAGPPYRRAPERVQSHVLAGIQEELEEHGLYHGPANGTPNGSTVEAISRFQETMGLPPTGRLDRQTLMALQALPGQQYGMRVRRAYRFGPYGPGPYGPYGPRPYGPYGPYGPYARNYW